MISVMIGCFGNIWLKVVFWVFRVMLIVMFFLEVSFSFGIGCGVSLSVDFLLFICGVC